MSTVIYYTFDSALGGPVGVPSAIEFDCTVSEVHSRAATATTHPVELGSDMTDHVRPETARLSLEVVITNTPLDLTTDGTAPATIRNAYLPFTLTGYRGRQASSARVKGGKTTPYQPPGGIGFPMTPITVTPGTFVTTPYVVAFKSLQFPARVDRVKRVFEVLEQLCYQGIEVSVQTDLKYYDSMVITSLSAPRTVQDSIVFGLELQELFYVTASIVSITKSVAEPRAKPEKDDGIDTTARIAGFDENSPQLQSFLSNATVGDPVDQQFTPGL